MALNPKDLTKDVWVGVFEEIEEGRSAHFIAKVLWNIWTYVIARVENMEANTMDFFFKIRMLSNAMQIMEGNTMDFFEDKYGVKRNANQKVEENYFFTKTTSSLDLL